VFAGGFTLEAAQAVGAAEETGTREVLEWLEGLVEQSLVLAERSESGPEMRNDMLEPVRQYGLECWSMGMRPRKRGAATPDTIWPWQRGRPQSSRGLLRRSGRTD
jgi:hypothetical protein